MDVVMGVAEKGGSAGPSGPEYYDDESVYDWPCPLVSAFAAANRVYQTAPPAPYPNVGPPCYDSDCGPYVGTPSNFCDFFHFWSNHTGGANFCFADGSVRFIPYTIANARMKAMATRAGGETVNAGDF